MCILILLARNGPGIVGALKDNQQSLSDATIALGFVMFADELPGFDVENVLV